MIRNVLCWLEESAYRDPQHIALEDGTSSMSYAELLQRAQEIGSFLHHCVAAQSPVMIYMDKGPSCVAAMLGAVYAGCFYTPVEPPLSMRTAAQIASVLQPACILCENRFLERAGTLDGRARIMTVEDIPSRKDALGLAEVRARHIDNDLLYVLFTDTASAALKGVTITHRSVIDFAEWACDALDVHADCRFGNQCPLSLDNSVLDIYCALRMGATVHFIPKRYFSAPARMPAYLREKKINTIFWTPTMLTRVANAGALEKCVPLQLERVFFRGEVMPCKTLNVWRRALPEARYVNMYGPTEITDVCTYFPVERDFADTDVLPIGFPCGNTRVMLVDGEICVSGTCLSPGYYRAPEKTRKAFVPNPQRPGITEMMYKTGDLGGYNQRGELMLLGRRKASLSALTEGNRCRMTKSAWKENEKMEESGTSEAERD